MELFVVVEVLLEVDGGCTDCAREAIVELIRKLELDRNLVVLILEVIHEADESCSARAKRVGDWLRTAKLE